MPLDKKQILQRVDDLQRTLSQIQTYLNDDENEKSTREIVEEGYLGTLGLFQLLYGANSSQIKALFDFKKSFTKAQYDDDYAIMSSADGLMGFLNNVKEEIESGLITTLMKEATGEVIADFISLAKLAADNGHKDSAAVLACAALEDALKRFALLNGINAEGKEMAQVANALKSKSFLKGPQGPLIESFIKLRNRAMHAEWTKFSIEEVKSLIAFVHEFLLRNFS